MLSVITTWYILSHAFNVISCYSETIFFIEQNRKYVLYYSRTMCCLKKLLQRFTQTREFLLKLFYINIIFLRSESKHGEILCIDELIKIINGLLSFDIRSPSGFLLFGYVISHLKNHTYSILAIATTIRNGYFISRQQRTSVTKKLQKFSVEQNIN